MTTATAEMVAAALDLDVANMPICYACLSFVSVPLHSGDDAQAWRAARKFAPDIWDEGLAEPALDALRAAEAARTPGAAAARREAEAFGGRSTIARAIVFRLAQQLAGRSRAPIDPEATKGWAGTGWTRF